MQCHSLTGAMPYNCFATAPTAAAAPRRCARAPPSSAVRSKARRGACNGVSRAQSGASCTAARSGSSPRTLSNDGFSPACARMIGTGFPSNTPRRARVASAHKPGRSLHPMTRTRARLASENSPRPAPALSLGNALMSRRQSIKRGLRCGPRVAAKRLKSLTRIFNQSAGQSEAVGSVHRGLRFRNIE